MAVNKNFVVKNGIEVATDLVYAPSDLDKVGIGSTLPTTKLNVLGGIAAQDGKFTGITTVVQEFNVGTSNTIFTVKGPRDYGSGSSFHSGLVGINTATPRWPVHIRGANTVSTGGTDAAFTAFIEGDVKVKGFPDGASGTPTGGKIEARSIQLDSQIGFVSTYNLDVNGISTFTGIATFTNAEFEHIIVSGTGTTNAPSAVFSGVKADGIGATTLNVSGVSTFQNNVHLLDGDILEFGGALHDNGDLKIYHNGSHSYIEDSSGTGDLYVISNELLVQNASGNKIGAKFKQNEAVDLFFNNEFKFGTVSAGASVAGILTASSGFEGYAGITTISPSGGITTFKSSDIFLYGSQTVYGAVGNGVTVVGLTSTKNLHVTGIASINQLDVGTVTSGLNVTGAGMTVAGISSISTLYIGAGGTVLLTNSEGTVRIGTASTPATVTLNGGSIPSIGLVIALGG